MAQIKELYSDLGNPPENINVIYEGTWLTRGHSSHVAVECIIEMNTRLVVDHSVLSNFCLGCSHGPKHKEQGYVAWHAKHVPDCQKNIDCMPGKWMCKLRYTTMFSGGDSRTFHALTKQAVYGFIKVDKKDCINHVHKCMGAALRGLVDKKKAQGEPLGWAVRSQE